MSQASATCPSCGQEFTTEDLLRLPAVRLIGMNVDHGDSRFNFYYFNHEIASCGTTFVVPVEKFRDYVREPIPDLIQLGSDACDNHCLRIGDHSDCSRSCRWAPYRRLFHVLLEARAEPR